MLLLVINVLLDLSMMMHNSIVQKLFVMVTVIGLISIKNVNVTILILTINKLLEQLILKDVIVMILL